MVCAANVGVVGFVFRWVWWLICVAGVGVIDFHSGGFGGSFVLPAWVVVEIVL